METADSGYTKIASSMHGDVIVSQDKVAGIVFDVVELDKKNSVEKTAAESILELVSPDVYSEFVSIGNEEIPYDKVASIDASEWAEIFPIPVVESLFENGDIDSTQLNDIVDSMSVDEKEAVASFVKNYSRS
jgi:hypothetical protein